MKILIRKNLFLRCAFVALIFTSCGSPADDRSGKNEADSVKKETSASSAEPLPSWNDGDAKKKIMDYVSKSTTRGGAEFILPEDRIAVFDNDGTLWAEQPLYFQLFYIFDRVRRMAPQHPEWKTKEPFKSVLEGNMKKALASGEKGLLSMMGATFGGMTGEQFNQQVTEWAGSARHPVTKRTFTSMIYQPMLELLAYLRANGFQTYIVSGGDIDFMRAFAAKVYGIPPNQVVGSSYKVVYQVQNDTASIMRKSEFGFLDDGPGKPVGIYQHIGQKPVFAAGNSDGDYQMLQWTASNTLPHQEIIVHHTDSVREWAYDRGSPIGKLEKGLDDARKYGWLIIDMKQDWKVIYPEEK